MTDFLSALRAVVGDRYVITDADTLQPFIKEYSGRYQGQALAAVRPATTQEVSDVVKLCAARKIAIVPQGGNTGLVGGSVPYDAQAIVLNLGRMNAIRSIDAANFSMTVEAGCVLQTIQQAAREEGLYFPLSLGAEGSCQIGGNIATNAGGILTIRYGNTRDLVLGLEVVLPNGEIWNGLRSLRKDNTGYNLKHLFVGSEGTLGIITAAVLKLFPDPGMREIFVAAVDDVDHVLEILGLLRRNFGENVQAFELMSRSSIECAVRFNPQCRAPLALNAPWYVLSEVTGGIGNAGLRAQVEDVLAEAFEKKWISDATLAQNEQQSRQFWTLRESLSGGAQAQPGGCIKHDVSVPIFKIPAFVKAANDAAERLVPGSNPVIFGHAGDGNLHYDLTHDDAAMKPQMMERWDEVLHAIHDIAQSFDGSIAAEHGIGTFKTAEMAARKAPVEMRMMRAIKNAFDPDGLFNPGVVLKK